MKLNTLHAAQRVMIALLMSLIFGGGAMSASAQIDPKYYAVEVSATVLTAPPQVRLSWTADAYATGYTVYRKAPTATSWTQLGTVSVTANNYVDGNVTLGSTFEYRIRKTTSAGYTGHGYVLAGINAPLVEGRGKVVLIVDNTYASALAPELGRLQQDLAGDGWTVLRHDVSRTATPPTVKALIKAAYDADPANVKSVFLFGHVPVPRSGNMNPDGHPDHRGAWASDAYYADMNGSWTDSTVNTTAAERSVNHNVPGDGRFDPSTLPSDLELAVGRVDLSNMTCFSNKTPSRSELDLLRQYLNKDHNFRHGVWSLPRRGLVCDNFGDVYGEAFAASGWRSFAPMFGGNTTYKAPGWTFFSTLSSQGYLWSYGTGGGGYTTCNGIGGSDDFALNDPKTAFVMLLGSYFGDWDNESNFLRATLGSSTHTLTVSWAGRPHWFYHHMGLGETIGRSALASQNNNGTYEAQTTGSRGVHTGFLGDPTLRLHPVLPVSNLIASSGAGGLTLSWAGSADTNIQGFHVYRGTNVNGPFARLNSNLLGATTFTDTAPATNAFYMVRAVKLESSGSGTYYNGSQGVFYTNTLVTAPSPTPTPTPTVTNSAVFVKSDTISGGTWTNGYGQEGHWIYRANPNIPSFAALTPVGLSTLTWNYGVTDPEAVLLPDGSGLRVAACWYSSMAFRFNVDIKDGTSHLFSAYFLDWDNSGRQQRVEIFDGTTLLSSQTISNFSNGIYLTWKVTGSVRMRITPLVGNGVVSAMFFDAVPAPVTPAGRYIKVDHLSRGDWKALYGSEGAWVIGDGSTIPAAAQFSVTGKTDLLWTNLTTDTRALARVNSSERLAAAWSSPTNIILDFNYTDGVTRKVAIYVVDWESLGRGVAIDLFDADTNRMITSQDLSNYAYGKYFVWEVKGHVKFRVRRISGTGVTVSGVFVGPATTQL